MAGTHLVTEGRFRRVVAAVDDASGVEHVVAWALHLADPTATLVFAHAGDAAPGDAVERAIERAGPRALAEHPEGRPEGAIPELAQRYDADLVVGSRAVARLDHTLSSVGDAVRARVSCSVLAARNVPPPRRILCVVDGSRGARRAARVAGRVAELARGRLTLAHVAPPASPRAPAAAADPLAGLPAANGVDRTRVAGDPAERILDLVAVVGYDLVVLPRADPPDRVGSAVFRECPASVLLVG